MEKFAPVTRIAFRYLAMYVALKGFLPEDLAMEISKDPDFMALFNMGVGAVIGLVNEGWYFLAKKYGWNT